MARQVLVYEHSDKMSCGPEDSQGEQEFGEDAAAEYDGHQSKDVGDVFTGAAPELFFPM